MRSMFRALSNYQAIPEYYMECYQNLYYEEHLGQETLQGFQEYDQCVEEWKEENWRCVGCKYGPPAPRPDNTWMYWVAIGAAFLIIITCSYYFYRRYYYTEEEVYEEEKPDPEQMNTENYTVQTERTDRPFKNQN